MPNFKEALSKVILIFFNVSPCCTIFFRAINRFSPPQKQTLIRFLSLLCEIFVKRLKSHNLQNLVRIVTSWIKWVKITSWKSPASQILKPKNVLNESIICVFPCVVLFPSNLILRHLKVLKLLIFLCEALFSIEFPKYWYNFESENVFVTSTPLVEKKIS